MAEPGATARADDAGSGFAGGRRFAGARGSGHYYTRQAIRRRFARGASPGDGGGVAIPGPAIDRDRSARDDRSTDGKSDPAGLPAAERGRSAPPRSARAGGSVQELFGWTETPRIAGGRVPVRLHLLGPNYRPVQITDDLRSFWSSAYFQVRKDLRVRYPKHSWPENPLSAKPEAKGGRRQG